VAFGANVRFRQRGLVLRPRLEITVSRSATSNRPGFACPLRDEADGSTCGVFVDAKLVRQIERVGCTGVHTCIEIGGKKRK
jgi:hypothetical protein